MMRETGQDSRECHSSSGRIYPGCIPISGQIEPFALRGEGAILASFSATSHKKPEIAVGCGIGERGQDSRVPNTRRPLVAYTVDVFLSLGELYRLSCETKELSLHRLVLPDTRYRRL